MSCFPPVRRHEECPRSFFDKESSSNKAKGFVRFECSELFVLSRRRAICSLDHRNQDESTRDNLCILDDICLSSSTNRDLFPSNNLMSATRGFSLSINKQQKQCLLEDSLRLEVVRQLQILL